MPFTWAFQASPVLRWVLMTGCAANCLAVVTQFTSVFNILWHLQALYDTIWHESVFIFAVAHRFVALHP